MNKFKADLYPTQDLFLKNDFVPLPLPSRYHPVTVPLPFLATVTPTFFTFHDRPWPFMLFIWIIILIQKRSINSFWTITYLFSFKIVFLSEILFRLHYSPLSCPINYKDSLIYRSLSCRYISIPTKVWLVTMQKKVFNVFNSRFRSITVCNVRFYSQKIINAVKL